MTAGIGAAFHDPRGYPRRRPANAAYPSLTVGQRRPSPGIDGSRAPTPGLDREWRQSSAGPLMLEHGRPEKAADLPAFAKLTKSAGKRRRR